MQSAKLLYALFNEFLKGLSWFLCILCAHEYKPKHSKSKHEILKGVWLHNIKFNFLISSKIYCGIP